MGFCSTIKGIIDNVLWLNGRNFSVGLFFCRTKSSKCFAALTIMHIRYDIVKHTIYSINRSFCGYKTKPEIIVCFRKYTKYRIVLQMYVQLCGGKIQCFFIIAIWADWNVGKPKFDLEIIFYHKLMGKSSIDIDKTVMEKCERKTELKPKQLSVW